MIILCGLSILKFKSSKVNKYIYIYNLASKSSVTVKERTLMWWVKKRENSDRKNSYFFNLCSATFTMIIFSTLVIAPQSNSGKCFSYGKTAFFLSGTFGWNGSNTFQRKITTTKHGCFFCKHRQEQLKWQKIILSSCNRTFKQVLSFLSNLTSALFILRIALSSHLSEIRSKLS